MILRFLGTACGVPTVSRYNASIALTFDDRTYVLDCGEPCAASLIRAGISPLSVKAAFITHAHRDHIAGLPTLIGVMRPYGRKEVFVVHLPEAAIPVIETYLHFLGIRHDNQGYEWALHPIKAGFIYEDDRLRLSAHPTKHADQSYAFCIEADGKRIVYSGDVRKPGEIGELYDGADVGIMELAHFPPEEVVSGLKGRKVGRLIITHLNHKRQGEEPERLLAAMLEEGLQGPPVVIARDGMVVAM